MELALECRMGFGNEIFFVLLNRSIRSEEEQFVAQGGRGIRVDGLAHQEGDLVRVLAGSRNSNRACFLHRDRDEDVFGRWRRGWEERPAQLT